MNSTIRNWLGVTLIVAILLLIFKKPFSYSEMQHAALAPYYLDFWILDIQDWWPYEEALGDKLQRLKYGQWNERDEAFASLIEATAFISSFIWLVLHVVVLVISGIAIYLGFFKNWANENHRR